MSTIREVLAGNVDGMTATAIAHAMGFSKAVKIQKELDKLVDENTVECDNSGRYLIYKLAKKAVAKKESKVATKESEEDVTVVQGERVTNPLPEASSSDIDGYKIANIKYKGKSMKKVTTPDGKNIRLEDDEKLLVINDEPKYTAKTAEDVITAIRKYALDQGLTVFSVNDIKKNQKISNDKDVVVKDDHIMFLSIKKHNKAA